MEKNEFESQYPVEDYSKKTFIFKKNELYKASTLDVISQQGKMADMMMQTLINDAIKRVGIVPSSDVGVQYDLSTGNFFVYVPRVICATCKARRGQHRATINEKSVLICNSCYEVMKKEEKK